MLHVFGLPHLYGFISGFLSQPRFFLGSGKCCQTTLGNGSIWGSAFILFNIWFGVQISVLVNAWYVPFWDLIQSMLTNGGGNIMDLYKETLVFLYIAMVGVTRLS